MFQYLYFECIVWYSVMLVICSIILLHNKMINLMDSQVFDIGVIVMESDTIAAISTPVGEGAISIVRLSGPNAIPIASSLFSGKNLNKVASHTIHYGKIIDPTTVGIADEVMVSIKIGRASCRERV